MNEDVKKRNKRLSIWLGLFSITVAVLSYRFWQNLAIMISSS